MLRHRSATAFALAGIAFGFLSPFSPPAHAAADTRDVVTDYRNQVVVNTFGHCVRTRWMTDSDACEPGKQVQRPRARSLRSAERTVYFEFNKAAVAESERAKLDSLAGVLKSDTDVRSVSIVGYADRIGSVSYNDRLSQRRAKAVENYLHQRGFLRTSVAKTRWLGESAPVTQCPQDLNRPELIDCLQKDRRVEVEIDFHPENAGTAYRR